MTSVEPTSFAKRIASFWYSCTIPVELPVHYEVLNPYRSVDVRNAVSAFVNKYYANPTPRIGVWGINPGRFGGGITGLPFVDPVLLKNVYNIPNTLHGKSELSAQFISYVIQEYGGAVRFFNDFFLGSLCPLGFVKNGININFYDDVSFAQRLAPSVQQWFQEHISFGVRKYPAVFLGSGKLQTYVRKHLYRDNPPTHVYFLEHPRYIMQYKRKSIQQYIRLYIETLQQCTMITMAR